MTDPALPLDRTQLAQLVAADIPRSSYVNLGIGLPTTVASHLADDQDVTLHTENGMLGMGPEAVGDEVDANLVNASKVPVTELVGASYFSQADSFAMMRGGHIDVCVMGAFQVAANGDFANWHTGSPDAIPAVGGAMDLASGARQIFVMMKLFNKDDTSKLLERCTYPLTGVACVNRVYTDHGVFSVVDDGIVVNRRFGISEADLRSRIPVALSFDYWS